MNAISVANLSAPQPTPQFASRAEEPRAASPNPELRESFTDFVGQTFYGQMVSAMRKSVHKPAYFHGGRAEEIFQGQLDQVLVEKMSDATSEQFGGRMFELFTLGRP